MKNWVCFAVMMFVHAVVFAMDDDPPWNQHDSRVPLPRENVPRDTLFSLVQGKFSLEERLEMTEKALESAKQEQSEEERRLKEHEDHSINQRKRTAAREKNARQVKACSVSAVDMMEVGAHCEAWKKFQTKREKPTKPSELQSQPSNSHQQDSARDKLNRIQGGV